MTEQVQEGKPGILKNQLKKTKSFSNHVTSMQNGTTTQEERGRIYEHIGINQMQEPRKKPALDTYITMILKTGKEFHAGATYQTQDFAAVCIDERGGVVSLDHYDVTLLLPPLSLHEPCLTVFLYLERLVIKRVHGNPTYASPVVRVGCVSNSGPTPFQENVVLSLPLFKCADNQCIIPFYQQDSTELWTELSAEDHAFIKDRSRCTMSIGKPGLYMCLNYADGENINSGRSRVVLPMQCSTFVRRRSSDDVCLEVAFWISSETKSQMLAQRENGGHQGHVDGTRELLLDISNAASTQNLAVDVMGICEGWTVYGGKLKHIQLSTIHEQLKRSDGLYMVDFKFSRNQSYEVELACKQRIYLVKDHKGEKQKLSLFRYNCKKKRSMSDDTDSTPENRIAFHRNSNNSREILDIVDRCLAHITKIISSNLNGIWEKRFAESLNIPTSLVKSSQEIFLINKALYVFVGSRVVSMNDNDIVLDFITAANAVAMELENETRRRNRAAKALSLPYGARLTTNPRYNRSSSYSVDVAAHMSRCLVTPPPRPPRRQSMLYYNRRGSGKSSDVCCEDKDRTSSESLSLHNGDVLVTSSPTTHSVSMSSPKVLVTPKENAISMYSEDGDVDSTSSESLPLNNEDVDATTSRKQLPAMHDEVFDTSFLEKLTLDDKVFEVAQDSR